MLDARQRLIWIHGNDLAFERAIDEQRDSRPADAVVGFDEGALLGRALVDQWLIVEGSDTGVGGLEAWRRERTHLVALADTGAPIARGNRHALRRGRVVVTACADNRQR